MLIEQPPILYRLLYKDSIWRIPIEGEKTVYLTFDDGPIPEITPWVLDLLDQYEVKATFFCVGDNVRKHPDIYQMVLDRGHRVGNHTFNHIQGIRKFTKRYVENTRLASEYIDSDLFRPPHGHMRIPQYLTLRKKYKIIMWDVVTRDYSKCMTPDKVLNAVKKYTRDGSIIVFHDSIKAEKNMKYALPKSIEWLKEQGYTFKLL
ncbi:polysaccharide deacetylase family protein [Dysgonomonas sp. ZJ709]|uniref:polysaccharide deacetylase family protein n=1 Tax=Dysgonomonas sp. ZJ709 TaxID=2709797 RepID=UPI0013EB4551|nr:polysaccharide deacetylase family protein [Dysgonomonas sp. ZJ709]